ncbi:hypothetical protein BH10ACT10_BH10ACT10_15180 [soil metagenome]
MSEPVIRFARLTDPASYAGSRNGLERERRDRLQVADDRAAFTAAHLLVRACAGLLLGLAPETLVLEQECSTCGRAGHGRPSLAGRPEVYVSLSHTRGCVAALAAHAPCGIDVEAVHGGGIPRGSLTPRESAWVREQRDPALAFTRLWVRKEASVKAGHGNLGAVGELDVLEAAHLRDWTDLPYVGAWVTAPPRAVDDGIPSRDAPQEVAWPVVGSDRVRP